MVHQSVFLLSGKGASTGRMVDRCAMATARVMEEAEEVAEVQSGEIVKGFVCKEYHFRIDAEMYDDFLENRCDVIDGWSEDMDSASLMLKVRGQKDLD